MLKATRRVLTVARAHVCAAALARATARHVARASPRATAVKSPASARASASAAALRAAAGGPQWIQHVAARAMSTATSSSSSRSSSAPATASSSSGGDHSSDGSSTGAGSWRRGVVGLWAALGTSALAVVVMNGGTAQSEGKTNNSNNSNSKPAASRRKASPQLYIPPSSESSVQVFTGNGNPALAAEVAMALGIQLGRATVSQFRDGESAVQIHDSVRGKDVFIIQSICGPNPNDRLLELLLMVTAMRRASANRITAVLPYFAYARQANSGMSSQGTIAAADVAAMLEVSGVDQVVTIDVHRPQLQGFFSDRTPVELLDPIKTVAPYFSHRQLARPVIASPVSGGHGIHRATHFQQHLSRHGVDAPLALLYVHDKTGFVDPDAVHHRQILDKPRTAAAAGATGVGAASAPSVAVTSSTPGAPAAASPSLTAVAATAPVAAAAAATAVVPVPVPAGIAGEVSPVGGAAASAVGDKEYVEVVGDVRDRDVIIVDDMIDTGSRMTTAAAALKKAGAKRVFAYATHGLFTGDAIDRINSSDLFEIVCFNTVPLPPEKWSVRIRQLSVSALIAECIRRLNSNDSLAPLFN